MTVLATPRSVVLLHGLRTSATMWRGQVELLRERGHEVFAVDLPGHGTRMDERFTLAGAMDTIGDAVARARHPVFLVGFSLGGYLALHWTGLQPRPVTGILAASCGTTPYRAVLEGWRLAARVIHAFPDRGRGLHDFAVHAAVRDPQLADDVLRGGVALEVMDDALRELRPLRPIASLRRIEQPVTLVNGSLDHFRLQERQYLRAARRGQLVHVAGATHMVSLTRPAVFNEVLLRAMDAAAPRHA
jgi:pimeloyl-ACP methyl ester carboxylesterase